MLNKKDISSKNRMLNKNLGLLATLTFLFLFINFTGQNFLEIYSQEQEQEQQQQDSSNSPIVLTAKLIDNTYRWIDSNNATNPTLNITSGIETPITIKSLEDDLEEHELIIEGISAAVSTDEQVEELVASDEIEDGSSTTINFNPADIQEGDNNYQSLEYYCEYHPDTMRGKIQIK
jgi:hypothetical protein